MDLQWKRGFMEVCVLTAMLKGDTYGYQLIKDIGGYLELSESTLYPVLRRLEEDGCLRVYSIEHNGRLRKYYSICEKGRKQICDFLSEWEQITAIYQYIKKEYEDAEK